MRNCPVSDIRKHIKSFLKENPRMEECTFSRSAATGFCVAASQSFTNYLKKNNCNAKTVCFINRWDSEYVNRRGVYHCVTRGGGSGTIIDFTSVQFDPDLKGPIVKNINTYKKYWDEYLGDIENIDWLESHRKGPWFYSGIPGF